MDLLTQLNRAVTYIEDHISDDLAISDIAGVTAYSPYHFGRLFYYIAEMPISEYVRKRKLSLAAAELKDSDVKVIDLAVKYGYDSADSFTRAFAKQHGVTPTAARQSGALLKIFPPLSFYIKIKGVQGTNWRIEERDAFEVFGIERVFGNDETSTVPDFWTDCFRDGSYERLFDDAGGKRYPDGHGYPLADGSCLIRAACNYRESGDNTFPYMLCAEKTEIGKTDGYTGAVIPKSTWAILRSDETENIGAEIPRLFNQIYSEWLPSSGYDKAPGPDLEVYGVCQSGKYFEEVWIPVVKKAQ
jgi:AraC-type DNA-binding domain-containing proteins